MTDQQNPASAPAPKGGGFRMPSIKSMVGLAVGTTLYYLMSRFLGVHVEVWMGINTFTDPRWFAAVAVVPALSGFVTGFISGRHGKWYGMLPVALLHPADYFTVLGSANSQLVVLSPGLFVFFMIIMLELGMMGGWTAEVIRARVGGEDKRA